MEELTCEDGESKRYGYSESTSPFAVCEIDEHLYTNRRKFRE